MSDRTLMQETALRARGPGFAPPIVVCNHEHRFLIAEQLRAAGVADARLVLEPVGRNSAPAIAAAALLVGRGRPGQPAVDAGRRPCHRRHRRAAPRPRRRRGGRARRPFRHLRHAARPGRKPATAISSGAIRCATPPACTPSPASWKSRTPPPPRAWSPTAGICGTPACSCSPPAPCWRSWKRTRRTCCRRCARRSTARRADLDFIRLDEAAFTAAPSISLDYAVAERTRHAAVVPADIGWSDVGSWSALWELGAA